MFVSRTAGQKSRLETSRPRPQRHLDSSNSGLNWRISIRAVYGIAAPDRQKTGELSKHKFQLSLTVLFICDSLRIESNADILFNRMRIMIGFSEQRRRWSAFSVSCNIVLMRVRRFMSVALASRVIYVDAASIFKTVFSDGSRFQLDSL